MYVDDSTSIINGRKQRRVLLRESYRKNGMVKKRTITNLTKLPDDIIAVIKSMVGVRRKAAALVRLEDIKSVAGPSFGSLYLLYTYIKRLGIEAALGKSREAMLIIWLICGRIMFQGSRLKAARMAKHYAVKRILKLGEFNEGDLYNALDWLSEEQKKAEDYLMGRGKNNTEGIYLYDVTSCYFEGKENELAAYGYNRDGKKGKKQIVIGLLTDGEGEPLSIEVFKGNTTDPKTCSKRIEEIKERFGARSITLVGDRGMIKGEQIKEILREGWNYITAITKPQIEKLIKEGTLQYELFDEELEEIIEGQTRYVLKRNPRRVEEIAKNRKEKLKKLQKKVEKRNEYLREHKRAKEEVSGREIEKYAEKLKVNNWATICVENRIVKVDIDGEALKKESKLDGCYVVKTNITDKEKITKEQIHNRYKDLALVEWAFRTIKTTLLENRPIYHRLEERTRAVCFISMLAYKVARQIIGEVSEHTEELLALLFVNESNADNQVLSLGDIMVDLGKIQETTIKVNDVQIPVIQTPSSLGEKVLSILKIKLPVLKAA